jgi:hypothetical protein
LKDFLVCLDDGDGDVNGNGNEEKVVGSLRGRKQRENDERETILRAETDGSAIEG